MDPSAVLEVSDFITILQSRRENRQEIYPWVAGTWNVHRKYGFSHCHPGDLKRFLKRYFGPSAVGSKSHSLNPHTH